MRPQLCLPIALLLVAGFLTGCGANKATNPAGSTIVEENEIVAELATQPALLEDGISGSQDEVSLGSSSPGLAVIQPLTYRRVIRERNRRFEFAFSDSDTTGRPTRAVVTIRTRLIGSLHILAAPPEATPGDSAFLVRKPLDNIAVRRVLMRRVAGQDSAVRRARWRVAAASGVQVTSREHTTHIVSLRLQGAGLDTTITDPLAFVRMRNMPRLEPNSEVALTVTTERPDDVVVLHRHGLRYRLRGNGDNTYSGTFQVGMFARGMRHIGVDALSRGTLFDDEMPYDSQAWVLPHVIVPEVLEDPLP